MRQRAKKSEMFIENEPWTLSSILGKGGSRGVGWHTPRGVTNPDLKCFFIEK